MDTTTSTSGINFFSKIKNFLKRDLSLSNEKAWNISLWNLIGSQSLSGENVTEQTALTYSAVYNAVSLISGTIAALPLHLMQRKGDKKHIADERKLYRVMHDEWNPYMTAMAGRELLMAHILTWGNAYAEKVIDGYGEIREIWPITPDRVSIVMQEGKLLYKIRMDREPDIYLARDKILHVPGLGFDGFSGYSVIAMARKSIGLSMAMESFGALFFGNGTHPGLVVSHPGHLKDPKAMREALNVAHAGLGKSHQLMLLEEGMKIEKLGIPPNDSQFLECVIPETMISMADGTRKAAKDIKRGDKIIGWQDNNLSIAVVSATGKPPIKNIIKIKTARGRELIASEDHPILAIDKLRIFGNRVPKQNPEKWIAIKDLRIGNNVRIALDVNFTHDRIISIEEVGEGETVGIEVEGCHTHVTGGIVTHNSRQFQIPEISRWFNLPPHKLKDLTKSSFSNIESEQISFITDSILPWLIRLEQNYNMQLLTKSDKELSGYGRLYFKHSVEGLLRGDAASRAAFYAPMLDRGVFSINDVRELEDKDPISGGDIHLVPLNMTSLENAGKAQELPSTKVMLDPALLEKIKGNGDGNKELIGAGNEPQ